MPHLLPFALPVIRFADVVYWSAHGTYGPRRLYDHELLYVQSGALKVRLGERILQLGPDQLILIPPRVQHEFWRGAEPVTHIGVHFDWLPRPDTPGFLTFRPAEEPYEETLFREVARVPHWDNDKLPVLDLRGRPAVLQLLLEVVAAHAVAGEMAPWQAGALLAAAIAAIGHEAALIGDQRDNPRIGPDAVRRVHRARELLEAPGDRPVAVAEAAARVGWSADHLTRMCREVLGVTPSRLQMRARLQRARQLLRYGNAAVPEVARRTGFEDVAHFCAVFKKETGLTPRQFALSRE